MNLAAKDIMAFVPMMSLDVEDLDAWWAKIQNAGLVGKYPGTR